MKCVGKTEPWPDAEIEQNEGSCLVVLSTNSKNLYTKAISVIWVHNDIVTTTSDRQRNTSVQTIRQTVHEPTFYSDYLNNQNIPVTRHCTGKL